ncbi:MAG: hypothetical protein MAG451_01711 [Anaerolineales bacterium]|nr:hypothetical protein [Anaerolineales bacterium]
MLLSRLIGLSLAPDQERLLWLAGSALLCVGVTNAAWASRDVVRRVSWALTASIAAGVARFAFYVGIPYAALLAGIVTLTSLGLGPAPSRGVLNQGALVAGGAVILMGAVGWRYRREVIALGDAPGPLLGPVRQVAGRPWSWVWLLITVIHQQVHWAFYRALPLLILDDRYAGGFVGLGLVLLEAYADPRVRRDLADPGEAEFLLLSASLAVVTTVLFVLTGTSWLGAGVHFAAVAGWLSFVQVRMRA